MKREVCVEMAKKMLLTVSSATGEESYDRVSSGRYKDRKITMIEVFLSGKIKQSFKIY